MNDLTGLELRKAACEALGWAQTQHGWWQGPAGSSWEELLADLPPIESNPAVSEPLFLAWCAKLGMHFTLVDTGPFSLRVFRPNESGVTVVGSSPSEARARAIVEASQKATTA